MLRWWVVGVVRDVQEDESWSEDREERLAAEATGCDVVLEERLLCRRRFELMRVVYGIVMAREPGGWAGSAMPSRRPCFRDSSC